MKAPAPARKARRRGKEPVSVKAVTFTRLGIDPDRLSPSRIRSRHGESPETPDEEYGPFEGPRFAFSLLLGESPTWAGPDSLWLWYPEGQVLCRFCHHLSKMPAYAYCLNCDRSGKDSKIPPAPLRRRVKARHADGLKGGCG